jgi:hypothetical protein
MNNKEQDYIVKNKNYFVLASIIIFLFILMMTMANLNYYIRKNKVNSEPDINNALYLQKLEKQPKLETSCLIVWGNDKKNTIDIVEDSLEKAKIGYISKAKFEDINDEELKAVKTIIINGSEFERLGNVEKFFEYIKEGKNIIFTSMPDVSYIETKGLKDIMGINNITESKNQKGVKFLPGFMLGGLLELPNLSYKAPVADLLSTTKTYVTGPKKSSVIWRNIYGESEIYVINGPFFETNAAYGIMSAIMAQINPDYIYPVVNAKVFTYEGLPYVSYENSDELEKIYNRDAMQLQQDILIPDILSANKSRGFIPSGFLTEGFNRQNIGDINKYYAEQINNYEKDIYKLGGEVGMVYSGDLEKDIKTYKSIFNNKNFKSILLNNNNNLDTMIKSINKDQCSFIESAFGPWTEKKKNFGYVTSSTVYIPFTIDGVYNTDQHKLEFYSGITAFGAIIQNIDLKQVIFPENDKDNWMNVLRDYVKFIDFYRQKYDMIQPRSVTDAAQAVKKFNNNFPSIKYSNNKIEIRLEKWYGESYYILRTNKEIDSITNGSAEKIEDGAYLVTVKNKEIDINLRQVDRYE